MIPMSTEPIKLDIIQIQPATELDMEAVATVLRDAFLEFKSFYTQAAYAETTSDPDTLRRRLREAPIWVATFTADHYRRYFMVMASWLCRQIRE